MAPANGTTLSGTTVTLTTNNSSKAGPVGQVTMHQQLSWVVQRPIVQRSWDHDNLYLVGCGNMPTVGTSNPTLTMTALALWAGDNIVADLAAF